MRSSGRLAVKAFSVDGTRRRSIRSPGDLAGFQREVDRSLPARTQLRSLWIVILVGPFSELLARRVLDRDDERIGSPSDRRP